MTQTKTARWLDLLALLLSRRYPLTREEIFERVEEYRKARERDDSETARESLRRRFERDKDQLRAIGINIETVDIPTAEFDEPAKGYVLQERDFYLPYLEFVDGKVAGDRPYRGLVRVPLSSRDLELLDRATNRIAQRSEFPLSLAAASARRKLQFDLPLSIRSVEHVLAAPLATGSDNALATLQRAVAARIAVSCSYYTIGRDSEQRREIEPYGLFFSWSRWYCVAFSRERDALRLFRVDRMKDVTLLEHCPFDVPDDFSVRDYVGRAPWALGSGKPTAATVRFSFPESRWVQAQGVGSVIEDVTPDGGSVIRFAVTEEAPFLRWLLTFRDHARVLEPDSMRGKLADMRDRVRALYAESDI
ncbi:MAG: helix-turn-helix transcriptional regulator [Gemmatimonadales bacterium]